MSVHGDDFKNTVIKADDLTIGDGNIIGRRKVTGQVKSKSYNKVDKDIDLFDIIDAPLPVSGEGDFLLIATETFQKALESNIKVSGDKGFAIQSIPKEVGQLPYDVLVLIYRMPNERAILYPFVVADSMEREYTHPVYFNQATKEYVVTPDTIYDMNVYQKIKRIISRSHPGYKFEHVGFLLIPRGFDYENNVSVKRLLNNAMNAIDTVIKRKVINSDHLSKVGLITKIRFAKDQAVTLHGRLARSDLSITLEATKIKKRDSGYKDLATSEDFVDINHGLIRCDGFVDLVFSQSGGGLFSNKQNATASYAPRLIITNMEQKQRTNTMGLTLVALASTYMLQVQRNWALALKRPRGKAMVNEWHDIGAVAYEMNTCDNPLEHDFTKKIQTNDPNFDNAALKQLVGKVFNDNFLVSLDIEMGGPQIWLQTHFSKAAYTADDHPDWTVIAEKSRNYIIDVANEITSGKFDELTGGKAIDVVFPGYEKIHLGSYEDENGELRDIRDICYRAILNSCNGGDLSHIVTWANSFDRSKSTEGARIALREDMIRRMTSGRVKFEAMARRVTFNPFFIQFLCIALLSKKVRMIPIISEGFSQDEDRYFANYARYGNDIDPIKLMLLKQKGIDIDNPSKLSPQDIMMLKMLDINPFERQMEAMMARFGVRNNNYEHAKGYSCF